MLFNSLDFAIFLPLVFVLHWWVAKGRTQQNLLLMVASAVFYAWWDWRFLSLILLSTGVDYGVGILLGRTAHPAKRRWLLGLSLAVNLGMLGFFKYFDFFIANFAAAFSFLGIPFQLGALGLILPVGISFYTFQTLSYTIDVYRGRLQPTHDWLAFAAFVGFFPQLVAGPIERAGQLLPQFGRVRSLEYGAAVMGLRQILWGLFKKMVVADNCAVLADRFFAAPDAYSGSALLLGAVCFAFQIYGDFSGYSDMAIGTAKLFGIRLSDNFAYPYFSRDVAEFWRRWHISLSTWFRDYLYIPLGGSRKGRWRTVRNVVLVFAVSGLWHGANWTFLVWGLIHAACFMPLLLWGAHRRHLGVVAEGRAWPGVSEGLGMLGTFAVTTLAWVFFRAESLGHAWQYLGRLCSASLFSVPEFEGKGDALVLGGLVAFMLVLEWRGRQGSFALATVGVRWPWPVRWGLYGFLVFLMGMFMQTGGTPFIYFSF